MNALFNSINTIRKLIKRIFYTALASLIVGKYEKPLTANGLTILTKNTKLGKNTNFNGLKISGDACVLIGDNFHSGEECLFITTNHNYDQGQSVPYDQTSIKKDIIIKDNVWLGSRVIILGGVTIGEGAIIQAGAVVVNDIPEFGIAGGNPAKVFKSRDVEHYKKLKSENKFI